jgi:hypothetical protein
VKRFTLAAILGTLFFGSELHSGQRAKPAEYDVKAAFLCNFGKFVRWPASRSQSEFRICVYGRDPFGPVLDSFVADETVEGKTVGVRRIGALADVTNCHIVFISQQEEKHLRGILEAAGKSAALTVSEIPQFTKRGGMIGFVVAEGKVRFEINLTPAEGAGLVLSPGFLRVARDVKRYPGV